MLAVAACVVSQVDAAASGHDPSRLLLNNVSQNEVNISILVLMVLFSAVLGTAWVLRKDIQSAGDAFCCLAKKLICTSSFFFSMIRFTLDLLLLGFKGALHYVHGGPPCAGAVHKVLPSVRFRGRSLYACNGQTRVAPRVAHVTVTNYHTKTTLVFHAQRARGLTRS
jgi:hypothetical protein